MTHAKTLTLAALGLGIAGLSGGAARGQYPPAAYGGQLPGQVPGVDAGRGFPTVPGSAGIPLTRPFRPPLSPYLNLLRGGDPAINYYYAVQPAVSAGASPLGSLTGAPAFGFSQLRSGFLPAAAAPTQDPVDLTAGQELPSLPSAAHPVSYGGITRYTPSAAGRPGFFGPLAPARKRK